MATDSGFAKGQLLRDSTIYSKVNPLTSTGITLSSGTEVEILATQGAFYKIAQGYLMRADVKITKSETPTGDALVTDSYAMESSPVWASNNHTGARAMDNRNTPITLTKGAAFTLLDTKSDQASVSQKMYKISFAYKGNNYNGWIASNKVGSKSSTTEAKLSKNDGYPWGENNSNNSSRIKDDNVEYTVGGSGDGADAAALVGYEEYTTSMTDSGINTETYDDTYYSRLAKRHFNTLGYPPKFNMDVDLQYTYQDRNDTGGVDITPGIGRVFGKTFLSNPPILSICPGKVKIFPNLMGTEISNIASLIGNAGESNASFMEKIQTDADSGSKYSGKMYEFEADTKTYGYYVNALCRACAILMNVGEEIVPNLGDKKLKDFDYSYWAIRSDVGSLASGDTDTSIFKAFWEGGIKNAQQILTSLVEDTTYLNFFLNGSETSVSETISTDTAQSPLDQYFNQVNDFASTINYFTGYGFNLGSDSSSITESLREALNIGGTGLSGIVDIGKNIVKGGKIVTPMMLTGSTYGKSISCSMKFVSPYGAPLAVFLRCIIPICHILALTFPKQVSDNMYTYPFVVQASQLGQFHVDLGIITNLTITRGGGDNTSWTVNSLPTEWDVTFDIVPLINELMITPTNRPLLFLKNDQLISYLGNMCGFDLIAYNARTKMEITKAFITNKFAGYPAAIERRIIDALYNSRLSRMANVAWG